MKRRILLLLLLTLISSWGAMAQINCSSGPSTRKLVCEFPIATGVLTNQTALGGTTASSSGANTAIQTATVLNIAVATQVSQLPLASASSGALVVYKNGVPQTLDNLGPILTDRAQTVGKNKVFLGFTASQFVFTDIDGHSLENTLFSYYRTAYNPANGSVLTNTYTQETTKTDFRLNQFIAVLTWGITDKLDVSMIVPIERVSVSESTCNPSLATCKSFSDVVDGNNNLIFTYNNNVNSAHGNASGVGDIQFNGKFALWKGERAAVSAATNLRIPTGDDLNFLGSGAWGINPYLGYSYQARFSPHARVGYQWNTKTVLNNPTLTFGGNQRLPGGMQYDMGADYAALKRVTIAADLLGNQYLNTPRLNVATTTINTNTTPIVLTTSTPGNSSYWISNVSAGLKWKPVGNLVLSANVLFQLINDGFRSRPTPLLGISYRF